MSDISYKNDIIDVQKNHLFNTESLINYLNQKYQQETPQAKTNLIIKQFVHGQSNPTFYIQFNNKKIVLANNFIYPFPVLNNLCFFLFFILSFLRFNYNKCIIK